MRDYIIKTINKKQCEEILLQYHYITKETKHFRVGYNYGLFYNDKLIGVVIYHCLSVPETAKGCFGLERNEQKGIFELGRLALNPDYYEKNLTSWFLSRTIKMLKSSIDVRAILTYADSKYHSGFIYQATNFIYYGLTDLKKDYWFLQDDGTYIKHQRGKLKGIAGEWRPRSRKHRYLLIFDKNLKCLWEKQKYPKQNNIGEFNKNIENNS